jgi:hypothetical protein
MGLFFSDAATFDRLKIPQKNALIPAMIHRLKRRIRSMAI